MVLLRVQSAGWSPDVERWDLAGTATKESENSGDEREGDEQEVALSEAARRRHPAADGVMRVACSE